MAFKRVVSSKGQVVVPKKIRDYLDLQEGDQLQFLIKETGEVTISPMKNDSPDILFGTLPPKSKNTENFEEVLLQSREDRLKHRKEEGKI